MQPAPDFGVTLGLLDWYKTNMTIKAKSQGPRLGEALGLGTSATHFRYFRGRLLKHHEGRQIIAAYTARAVWRTPIVAAFLSSFCMGSSEDLGSPPMGSSDIIGSLLIVLGVILGSSDSLMY